MIVLAIAGLVTGWYVRSNGPDRIEGAIVALRSMVAQARFEAIERSVPVAVVYRPGVKAFVTLAGESGSFTVCEAGAEVSRLVLSEFPGVEVERVPSGGLVWLPSGSGRTCSGSGAFNQTITLSERDRDARLIVSRAGRIRSEVDL